jgi:predicted GNAT superfamily acetyltransferase
VTIVLAGYLHRLVVARRAAGQGLGARLNGWACAHVAAHNRQYLRLDCGAENSSIRAYYEGLDVQHIHDVEVNIKGARSTDGSWRASLYERAARGA